LFLLTDGEVSLIFLAPQYSDPISLHAQVWGLETIFASVQSAVSSASPDAFIRIFTLGIGHGASTAMCEGIARAGNGTCLMAIQNEEVAGKCARLLRASRTPPVTNLRIDWGIKPNDLQEDFDIVEAKHTISADPPPESLSATVSMFDESADPISQSEDTGAKPSPEVILAPPPLIQQAPFTIPVIYPGTRFTVSALISSEVKLPDVVTLRGDLLSGLKLELEVPVQHVDSTSPPLIHTLAARRLIQDLEDGKVKPRALNAHEVDAEAIVKAAIVRLSTGYQLTSKYASFVAVQEVDEGVEVSGVTDETEDQTAANIIGSGSGRGRGFAGLGKGGAMRHRRQVDVDSDDDLLKEAYEFDDSDDDMGFGLFNGGSTPPRALAIHTK
jgi:hypothetical protein